jgi:hypothetical protein
MGELAQHDIELSVVERQLLSIALAPVHVNLGEVRVFTSAREKLRGQIDASDPSAQALLGYSTAAG